MLPRPLEITYATEFEFYAENRLRIRHLATEATIGVYGG